jgi:hypothetical protein
VIRKNLLAGVSAPVIAKKEGKVVRIHSMEQLKALVSGQVSAVV